MDGGVYDCNGEYMTAMENGVYDCNGEWSA